LGNGGGRGESRLRIKAADVGRIGVIHDRRSEMLVYFDNAKTAMDHEETQDTLLRRRENRSVGQGDSWPGRRFFWTMGGLSPFTGVLKS
jgi:hypothetical protein